MAYGWHLTLVPYMPWRLLCILFHSEWPDAAALFTFSLNRFPINSSTMPTVIALDLSLSMLRSVRCSSGTLNYHQMAVQLIDEFLDYLQANVKLEYVSLVSTLDSALISIRILLNY